MATEWALTRHGRGFSKPPSPKLGAERVFSTDRAFTAKRKKAPPADQRGFRLASSVTGQALVEAIPLGLGSMPLSDLRGDIGGLNETGSGERMGC